MKSINEIFCIPFSAKFSKLRVFVTFVIDLSSDTTFSSQVFAVYLGFINLQCGSTST